MLAYSVSVIFKAHGELDRLSPAPQRPTPTCQAAPSLVWNMQPSPGRCPCSAFAPFGWVVARLRTSQTILLRAHSPLAASLQWPYSPTFWPHLWLPCFQTWAANHPPASFVLPWLCPGVHSPRRVWEAHPFTSVWSLPTCPLFKEGVLISFSTMSTLLSWDVTRPSLHYFLPNIITQYTTYFIHLMYCPLPPLEGKLMHGGKFCVVHCTRRMPCD